MNRYKETRIVFDEFIVNKKAFTEIIFRVNDHMSLASVSMKDLLSSTKTNQGLTKYITDNMLKYFQGRHNVV